MRKSLHDQLGLVLIPKVHEHARELQAMNGFLNEHPEYSEYVQQDLLLGGVAADKGRKGMSGEQTLRFAMIKQMNGYSYDDLAFHAADSVCYRAFCRIGIGDRPPSRSALQQNINTIRAETFERINRGLVVCAKERGIDDGKKLRGDSTVIESDIHAPSDSSLLLDCVKVLVRLLKRARSIVAVDFSNHQRRAKRRAIGIQYARVKARRVPLYRDLVKVTRKMVHAAHVAVEKLETTYPPEALQQPELSGLLSEITRTLELTECVIDQTVRRVFNDEKVPAAEKIVSILEPHTDVICKDRRETLYGHKVFLTAGASGLVFDCLIERGNPADASNTVRLAERHKDILGGPPEHAVFDGGFSSRDNFASLKAMGISNVVFSKHLGIKVTEMVKDSWLYKRMRHFRAGIEGIISLLKRCFGWSRCTWRSFPSFRAYAWSSVVAANLLTIARHTLN